MKGSGLVRPDPSFLSALPIFPVRLQTSIFGAGELNFRVRDGNGWTLTAINTNYFNWLAPIKINYFIIQRSHYAVKGESLEKSGDPCGNRTHVCGVRGRRLSRLTNGPLWCAFTDSNRGPTD